MTRFAYIFNSWVALGYLIVSPVLLVLVFIGPIDIGLKVVFFLCFFPMWIVVNNHRIILNDLEKNLPHLQSGIVERVNGKDQTEPGQSGAPWTTPDTMSQREAIESAEEQDVDDRTYEKYVEEVGEEALSEFQKQALLVERAVAGNANEEGEG